MNQPDTERDPLEVLAAEFVERQRSGQSPTIAEYAEKHPELAAEIQDLFPAIAAIEQLKAHKAEAGGARVSLGAPKLERLGDFRILDEIGRGGMGIVYEAFQESLGRHVAVKVLPRQSLLDPKHLQRFQRESQTAARLHHTNIVPVFGVGEQDGFHYIVMQLIRGVGLDAIFAEIQKPDFGSTAAQGECDGTQTPQKSPSEAVRLAEILFSGQFWKSKDSGILPFRCDDITESLDKNKTAAADGQPAGASAATEDFQIARSTEVNRSPDSPSRVSQTSPVRPGARRFGPAYWRSIAAIGMQVADALNYAHSHHTLHRDIKPANLLLDSQGVVWITDFGLAKAMEQDNVTQTGGLVGTLRYMAPEQFFGQFDARSDIYSLGLTLYEFLTLHAAFEGTNRSSIIQKITHGEPIRPRKHNPGIPRDLETIVLKAIARDPAHRYQSAGDLARDLQCFLEDRPIQARRASAVEKLWRWSRRNKVVSALGASTLVLLVLVAVVASVGYVRTKQANNEEAMQRKKAENTSALALEALDNIFQQFAPDRTASASALTVVDDTGNEITVPVQPVLSKEAAALLERMVAFYDRLAAQGGDDARLRRKVAEANRRVGDIRQRLGHYEESKAAYLRAIDLYKQLAEAPGDNIDLRTEIARIQNELGNVYWAMNEMEAGHASYLDALATLNAAAADSSASPQYQYELARTHYYLGRGPGREPGPPPFALGGRRGPRPERSDFDNPLGPPPPRGQDLGRADRRFGPPDFGSERRGPPPGPREPFPSLSPKEREESLQKAIDILEKLVAEHADVPDYRHLLARCYREAPFDWFGRRPDSVPQTANKAIQIMQKLVEEYPDVPDYSYDLSETYAIEAARNQFASEAGEPRRKADIPVRSDPSSSEAADPAARQRSREMLEKALAISEELVARHPNIPDYAVSQVFIHLHLAGITQESDRAGAEANLRKALDLQSALARRYPKTTSYKFGMAMIYESLALLLDKQDDLPEARSMLQASIASLTELSQSDPKGPPINGILAHHYMSLADLLRRMGENQAASEADAQARNLRPGP
jgi:serine/threonine protein kinase